MTARGPIRIAMAAARYGSRFIHVSSDAVFSGAHVQYDESSLPDPLTPYGAAKAAAETGVLTVCPEAAVARTSLIIGHGRSVHERVVHELAAGAEGASTPTTSAARYTSRTWPPPSWNSRRATRPGSSTWPGPTQ